MSRKSVTVFVRRIGGSFHANTMQADAIHRTSATVAARMCAARHFGVSEHTIDVQPDDDHVMIATIRNESAGHEMPMFVPAFICFVVGTIALALIYLKSEGKL